MGKLDKFVQLDKIVKQAKTVKLNKVHKQAQLV